MIIEREGRYCISFENLYGGKFLYTNKHFEVLDWLLETFGIAGDTKVWYLETFVEEDSRGKQVNYHYFSFQNAEDATLFVLRWR